MLPARRLILSPGEAAPLGAVQRDLAELLMFTLSCRASRAEVAFWLERARDGRE